MENNTLKIENRVLFPVILEKISQGHTASVTARGYSMRPFIEHNRDTLIFGSLGEVRLHDVVLAEIRPGEYVCHRIIAIDADKVTLLGDGNWASTETCRVSDLRASLISISRRGRTYNLASSRVWRIYSTVWISLFPIRRYLLAILRRIRIFYRK